MTDTVTVNGEPYVPADGETLLDLVAARMGMELNPDGAPAGGGRLGAAVAVDQAVVPRSRWSETPVAGTIDLVTAAQGG